MHLVHLVAVLEYMTGEAQERTGYVAKELSKHRITPRNMSFAVKKDS